MRELFNTSHRNKDISLVIVLTNKVCYNTVIASRRRSPINEITNILKFIN